MREQLHDEALLQPYVARYHEVIGRVWDERTHHIAESLAVGLYPLALATPELRAASQTWLLSPINIPEPTRPPSHSDRVFRLKNKHKNYTTS
ncbi:hypothetical protein [Escherichia coli]|uniref:hypothetical protein n=1 Tax=Escherichia coli TaxID=562 RepID=UPI001124D503|nr:hypothetical protein [Escherichia coli]